MGENFGSKYRKTIKVSNNKFLFFFRIFYCYRQLYVNRLFKLDLKLVLLLIESCLCLKIILKKCIASKML